MILQLHRRTRTANANENESKRDCSPLDPFPPSRHFSICARSLPISTQHHSPISTPRVPNLPFGIRAFHLIHCSNTTLLSSEIHSPSENLSNQLSQLPRAHLDNQQTQEETFGRNTTPNQTHSITQYENPRLPYIKEDKSKT